MTVPKQSRNVALRPSRLFIKLLLVITLSSVGILLAPSAQYSRRNSSTDAFVTDVSFLPLRTSNSNIAQNHPLSDIRECTSPEYNVTWPLHGNITSASSDFSCGISSNSPLAKYIQTLSTFLQQDYAQECKQAVRFGVAFGKVHAGKLRPFKRPPHKCVFMFVLEDEMPVGDDSTLSFGFETLVPVPRDILPYTSTRRNVKLFKLYGHFLFPFTKLLVWQDVKLKGKFFIPTEYFHKFLAVGPKEPLSCVAAVGLPTAIASFGQESRSNNYIPKYQDHCNTVVGSISRRPNVTDSPKTLLQQCQYYQDHIVQGTCCCLCGMLYQ